MNANRWVLIAVFSLLPMYASAASMDITVQVRNVYCLGQGAVDSALVELVFNPGTSYEETVYGTTDETGRVTVQHDRITSSPASSGGSLGAAYPNPAGHSVTLRVAGHLQGMSGVNLSLYDVRGRRVFRSDLGTGTLTLPQPLPAGKYFYRLSDGYAVLATDSFLAVGGLRKVHVRFDEPGAGRRTDADEVRITVSEHKYEDATQSYLLGDGTHELTIELTPAGYCMECLSVVSMQHVVCPSCGGNNAWTISVAAGCDHLSGSLYQTCSDIVYVSQGYIAPELAAGTDTWFICVNVGYCMPDRFQYPLNYDDDSVDPCR